MAQDPKPFHNPFGALASLKTSLPASADAKVRELPDAQGPANAPGPETRQPPAPGSPIKGPARAVVRMERAGRGGKEVTVVEHLGLRADDLEKWLKALKAGLGCGGVVEGGSLVLQGDHRERLPKLLAARGVRKVTVG